MLKIWLVPSCWVETHVSRIGRDTSRRGASDSIRNQGAGAPCSGMRIFAGWTTGERSEAKSGIERPQHQWPTTTRTLSQLTNTECTFGTRL